MKKKIRRQLQCTLQNHVRTADKDISKIGICEDVRHHFPEHSYNITINSHNGQLTLHMRGGRINIERQIQTTVH
jgi:hypothetical protein